MYRPILSAWTMLGILLLPRAELSAQSTVEHASYGGSITAQLMSQPRSRADELPATADRTLRHEAVLSSASDGDWRSNRPMSIDDTAEDHLYYEASVEDPGTENWLRRTNTVAELAPQERPTSAGVVNNAQLGNWVQRIAVNLAFVLSVAVGIALLFRKWQAGHSIPPMKNAFQAANIRVIQVLPLSRGMSLHFVVGLGRQFVVATDATGIKSVCLLPPDFDESIDERQTLSFPENSGREASPEMENQDEEIDRKLISLLLQGSKKAA